MNRIYIIIGFLSFEQLYICPHSYIFHIGIIIKLNLKYIIMSFKTILEYAGKKRNVLSVEYAMLQETDKTGRPSSVTRGGKILLTVEGTGETDLFEWMTNSFERKDGSVKFVKRDSDATLKELKFTEAYIVKYNENFDASGENPLTETFVLSAKEIELGNAKHTNEWV